MNKGDFLRMYNIFVDNPEDWILSLWDFEVNFTNKESHRLFEENKDIIMSRLNDEVIQKKLRDEMYLIPIKDKSIDEILKLGWCRLRAN